MPGPQIVPASQIVEEIAQSPKIQIQEQIEEIVQVPKRQVPSELVQSTEVRNSVPEGR